MLKRPHYIALGLVVVLTLTILNLPNQAAARLKLAVGSFFLPLFGLAASTHEVAAEAGNSIMSRRELLKENERLRRENQQFRLQSLQTAELERENAKLRQLFGSPERKSGKYKLARVVLREPANWWRTMQIDLGSRDGARENMAVLSEE